MFGRAADYSDAAHEAEFDYILRATEVMVGKARDEARVEFTYTEQLVASGFVNPFGRTFLARAGVILDKPHSVRAARAAAQRIPYPVDDILH